MFPVVSLSLILAMAIHIAPSSATWCICKEGISDNVLQKTLDYACGAGADCNPLHQNGVCFNPNTVRAHCNYAVNSYYQRKMQIPGSCDFAGTAMVVTSDPSAAGCAYPATASAGPTTTNTTTAGATTPTSSSTGIPIGPAPPGTSPLVTPTGGVLGGINNGMGPSGAGYDPDGINGGILLLKRSTLLSTMIALLSSALVFLWV